MTPLERVAACQLTSSRAYRGPILPQTGPSQGGPALQQGLSDYEEG